MISTSTIRISVVTAAADLEKAARVAAHRVRPRLRPGVCRSAPRAQVARADGRRADDELGRRCKTGRRWRAANTFPGRRPAPRPRSATAPTRSCARRAGCSTTQRAPRSTLAEFVETGDQETGAYLHGVRASACETTPWKTIVEIGSGIGRMTAGFTRLFGTVYRLRSRRRVPRAVPRDGRAVRRPRAAAARATSPTAARLPVADDVGRHHVQLHHAAALPARRRAGARRARRSGSPGPAARSRSTSARGSRATSCCGRSAR